MAPDPAPSEPPPPRRYQFRLGFFFLLMTLVAALAAGASGLLRLGQAVERPPEEVFLVIVVAAPLGLSIVLSLYYSLLRWLQSRR